MDVVIRGEPKEIADLVLEIQGRREIFINPEAAARAICDNTQEAAARRIRYYRPEKSAAPAAGTDGAGWVTVSCTTKAGTCERTWAITHDEALLLIRRIKWFLKKYRSCDRSSDPIRNEQPRE